MKPTIGRRLWFFMSINQALAHGLSKLSEQPFDAGVIYVNETGTVNLQVTDHMGAVRNFLAVPIVTEPEDHGHPYWAEWMPYQKEQAAKQETTPKFNIDSQAQQAAAWLKVVGVLDDIAPNWMELGPMPMDAACAQIQQFAYNEAKSKSLLHNLPQTALSPVQLKFFLSNLETKPGWGKNELKDMLLNIIVQSDQQLTG
jgi:hypothetical protein